MMKRRWTLRTRISPLSSLMCCWSCWRWTLQVLEGQVPVPVPVVPVARVQLMPLLLLAVPAVLPGAGGRYCCSGEEARFIFDFPSCLSGSC